MLRKREMKEEMMVLILLILLVFVVKVYMVLWWKPKKIEKHFGKQGIKGPSYCFFIGNAKEIVSLMMKASSQPMAFSHNILPRVLSFYHHWNKIYGMFSILLSFCKMLISMKLHFIKSNV